MNEKQKLYRVKRRAIQILRLSGYRVIPLPDDPVFDLEASRESEIRKLKLLVRGATSAEVKKVSEVRLPNSCRKEIWTKLPNRQEFDITAIS